MGGGGGGDSRLFQCKITKYYINKKQTVNFSDPTFYGTLFFNILNSLNSPGLFQ